MRRLLVAAVTAALMVTITACFPATFTTGAPPGEVYVQKGHFFLYGWIGETVVDAGSMCPRGVSSVRSQSGVVDVILTLVTGYLYTPRTIIVTCAGGVAENEGSPDKIVIGQDDDGQAVYVAKQNKDGSVEVVSPKGGTR